MTTPASLLKCKGLFALAVLSGLLFVNGSLRADETPAPYEPFTGESADFSEGAPPPAPTGKGKATTTSVSGPIAPAGTQPKGTLSGRVVFTSGGHGWTYNNDPDSSYYGWFTQRGVTQEMNEDYGNMDQMTLFAYYCFNAGATVVPLRPIGHQTNEVVLDNVNAAVTWSGTWSDSSSTIFYGNVGALPYRFASVSATETATATYTPNIPVAGFYPVYCWTRHGSDRTSQLYRLNHAGGQSQVRVPHDMVGNGWVYLGTYYFNAGSSSANGAVIISNLQPTPNYGSVVIADAIRFGNGMGDVVPTPKNTETPTVSGYPREEECSRYWIQRGLGQGQSTTIYNTSSDDQNDNVGAPPRAAREMNREQSGNMFKRVYIGFHSNAGGGRGCVGLFNNGTLFPGTDTPNQASLAYTISTNLDRDMKVLPLEVAWQSRSTLAYGRTDYAFGEINNSYISDEFDATIIECAFHDEVSDAKNLRDTRVRNWMARAVYQGVVEYMNQFDGLPLNLLPEPPEHTRAIATASGIQISWTAPAVQAGSGTATNYAVYRSTDGYAFGNPVYVTNATTYTFTGLANDTSHFFRIAAFNLGGESLPSETVACRRAANQSTGKVLVVNGYERLSRTGNLRQTPTKNVWDAPDSTGNMDRVIARTVNSFDYVVQYATSISAYGMPFDSCQNNNITGNQVFLTNYPIAMWICGNESTSDETFSSAEQTKVQEFLNSGKRLFVSGSEIGWDLDRASGPTTADRAFYNNYLHADFGSDTNDASGSYTATAVASSIFNGNSNAAYDNGNSGIYWVQYPDILTPFGSGTTVIANYANGSGAAAIRYDGSAGGGKVIYFGFPFETITSATVRNAYMADILSDLRINTAPVLAAIGNKTVSEGSALTFTASATDADVPANTLTYSLDSGNPVGSSINSSSGAFSWTPTEAQGSGNYSITVRVTDNGSPALNDFETITVTVNEVNVAPVLAAIGNKTVNEGSALTFIASATDADVPANTLTYSLDSGNPVGSSINSSSGAFSWTPTETQGSGNYSITVRVTDNGSPALNDFETITVTVNEVNVAPVLAAIGNKTVNEGSALTFTASATDADVPANTLTYSLDSGNPVGSSINSSSGAFTWTPTETQGPGNYSITVRVTDNGSPALNDFETITVTANEANVAPALTLGIAAVTETFVNFETFANGTANGTVMFRQPTFSGTTSAFLGASPNTTFVTNGYPSGHTSARVLKASWNFKTGTINPWLRLTTASTANIPNPTIDLGQSLRFTMNSDKALKVALGVRESGTTAAIGADGGTTGGVEWVGVPSKTGSAPNPSRTVNANVWTNLEFNLPTEAITNFSGGNSALAAGKGTLEHLALVPAGGMDNYNVWLDNFEIISRFTLPATITIYTSNSMTFTAAATDSDLPAQSISYSLDAGNPLGSSINSSSGVFTWTPSSAQVNTTNVVTVRATDNGSPAQSAAQAITVIVQADPLAVQAREGAVWVINGETMKLNWDAVVGKTYRIQYKDSLDAPAWSDLGDVIAAQTPETVVIENVGDARFYRIIAADASAAGDQ